jgi:hypothetical protein
METLCSQCNAPMSCNPTGDCWCFTLPPVLPIPSDTTQSCLCPTCLAHKLAYKPLQK